MPLHCSCDPGSPGHLARNFEELVTRITTFTVLLAALASAVFAQTPQGSIVEWGLRVVGVDLSHGFISVVASSGHSLGLKADGSIVAWGDNSYGQTNVPPPNTGFIAIAAGSSHSLGLKGNGSIAAWGCGGPSNHGQCDVPSPNTGFIAVAAGYEHSLGLKADGSIVAWGDNSYGQMNVPSPDTAFIAVAAGDFHSLGLKADGSIVSWGYNQYGQTNVPSPNTGFIAVAASRYHTLGLKADGSIVAWGYNASGQTNVPSPNAGFIGVAAGASHSLGLKANGSIVAWGNNSYGQSNGPAPNAGFIAVAAGGGFTLYRFGSVGHSLGLKADGSIVAWGCGSNDYGQCNVPAPNAGFIAVAAGELHSLGVKGDGSVVAWGANFYGQTNVPSPNTGFIAVAAGEYHSLGLKADGSIVAWGWDSYGQTNVPSPNTGFIAVAAGGDQGFGQAHSLGLKTGGTIVAWGCDYPYIDFGQCDVPSPNTGFIAVAAGGWHSLGLKADGSIVAWGDNSYGQTNIPPPNTGFIDVAAGGPGSLGLKADGSVVAWGAIYGQTNVPSPNTGFIAVAAGGYHSLAIRSDVLLSRVAVTPLMRDVSAIGGCESFSVSNEGAGTMPWSAAVTQGSSWLRIRQGFSGVNDGTIYVAYDANPNLEPRSGTIRVSAPGAIPPYTDVTLIQAGASAADRRFQRLEIAGRSLVLENSSTPYECWAYYSYGPPALVPASWSLQSPNFCCPFVSSDGVLTAGDVPSDHQWVYLGASYDEGCVTRFADWRYIRVNKALPDLTGNSFSGPQNLEWGKKLVVQFSLRNTGAGDAAPTKVGFYLKDDVGHRFDLYGTKDVRAIGAGEVSGPYDRAFILPCSPPNALLAAGAVSIGMVIDPNEAVPESNESNNQGVGEGVDFIRANISTPSRCFVNGVVFDAQAPRWSGDATAIQTALNQLASLNVNSARFWMNWDRVMKGVPADWRSKSPEQVTIDDITACANRSPEFVNWVDWSAYDAIVTGLNSRGITPVALICDGMSAPYAGTTDYRVSPDAIDEECSTGVHTSDCPGSDVRPTRYYKGVGEGAYLALVKLFAGAAAMRYSEGDMRVEMWNLENEPNWFPVHVLAAKWRCGPLTRDKTDWKWLDIDFTGRLLQTMRDAVLEGNSSAKTTINWNATVPLPITGPLYGLRRFADSLHLELSQAGVLGLWDRYLEPVADAAPWELRLWSWSQYADVIGLGFYPNYLHSWPLLGGKWASDTVQEAGIIARTANNLNPKPVQVLETGYPTEPTNGGCTGLRNYSEDLQAEYIRGAYDGSKSAYNEAVVAGAEGFYALMLEDGDSDGDGTADNQCAPPDKPCLTEVESHFGLVKAAGQAKSAFGAYQSLIAENSTASSVQRLSVQALAAVAGSLFDSEQERVVTATAGVLGTVEGPQILATTFLSDRVAFPMALRIAWGQGGVVAQLLDPAGSLFYEATGTTSPLETSLRLPIAGEWQLQVWGVNMPAEGDRVLAVVSTSRYAPTDLDRDGDVDLADFRRLMACFNGPDWVPAQPDCDDADILFDGDVDLADFALWQNAFTGR